MKRQLTYLIGPEVIMLLVSGWVWWHCRQHPSGEGRDVEILERTLMLLPFCVVPLVFATIFVTGAKNWLWLCRANVALIAGLMPCAYWLVCGFGSGSKGQDVGMIMVLAFGIILAGIGSTVAGAMILAATKPAFALWFSTHRFFGVLAVAAAAIPISFAMSVGFFTLVGLIGGIWIEFTK